MSQHTAETRQEMNERRQTRVLEALREAVERFGVDVTFRQFNSETGISQTYVEQAFGSWSAARKAAGLRPQGYGNTARYSHDEMLDMLADVVG